MYSFGAGSLFGVPTATNATPVQFGGLQDVSVDFSFQVKELYGSYQFALAIARGTGKIACKAKNATINGLTMNNIFFGQTLATGKTQAAIAEAGVVPASVAYTVTVSNSATFVTDLGVTYAATGLPLTKVASLTAAGQYTVSAGVYTFYSADASAALVFNYTYTVSASGEKLTITNQLLGTTPFFSAAFSSTFNSKSATFVFNRCTSSKMSFATKLEDFVIPEFDFSVFADDSGTIGTLSFDK